MSGLPRRESPPLFIQRSLDLEAPPETQVGLADSPLFKVVQILEEGDHRWAVVHCACDPDKADDQLIAHIAQRVRDAYGEAEIIEEMREQEYTLAEPEASVGDEFNLDALVRGFRMGLPDPDVEVGKIDHMTNYRSESAELVAIGALSEAYSIRFPVGPQRGKTNANQPILGFDNWGFITQSENEHVLVLVQVKGTEDKECPPAVVHTLVDECARVNGQEEEICRALSVLLLALKDTGDKRAVMRMLTMLGNGQAVNVVVAPAVVRGRVRSHIDDLEPLRSQAHTFAPAVGYGVTVSLEQDLLKFGRAVMLKARSDD